MKKPLMFISFIFSLRYCKDICYFGYLKNGRLCTPKVILSICKKFGYLFLRKKLHSPRFLDYCKDMWISYFGYFGHAWPHTPKMYQLVENFNGYLCAKNKHHYSLLSWDIYYMLKNNAIWLASSILAHNSEFC